MSPTLKNDILAPIVVSYFMLPEGRTKRRGTGRLAKRFPATWLHGYAGPIASNLPQELSSMHETGKTRIEVAVGGVDFSFFKNLLWR